MFTELRIPAGRRPLTRGEAISAGIFLAIFFGLIVIGLLQDFKPANASVLFFLLLWGPMLVVHELGHAIVAWLVGWRVGEISIGFGPRLFQRKIAGTEVVVHLLPLEGFVRPAPRSTTFARLKMALVYFAGPGAELLVLAILVGIYGWFGVFNSNQDYFSIALKSLGIVILFGAGLNLIPFPAGRGVSDGLGILLSPFMDQNAIRDHMFSLEAHKLERLIKQGRYEQAGQLLAGLKQSFAESKRLEALESRLLSATGNHQSAIELLQTLLEKEDLKPTERRQLLFEMSLTEMFREEPAYKSVQQWAGQISAKDADGRLSRIVKGCSLVRRGYAKQGGKILADAFQETVDPQTDPIVLAYLTIAARRVRNRDAAERFRVAFDSYQPSSQLKKFIDQFPD